MTKSRYQVARLLTVVAALLAGCANASAQTGPVSYTLTLDKRPTSHLVHIALTVNAAGAASIDVAMPAWAPGAYGAVTYSIKEKPDATDLQKRIFRSWLAENKFEP